MKKLSFITVCFFSFLMLFAIIPGYGQTKNNNANLENGKKIILANDLEISRISSLNGVLRGFYPFMTEKSILLPVSGHPVVGKDTCAYLVERMKMDGRQLPFKWEPLFAGISAAGDLAYSYGRYELPAAANKTGDNKVQETSYGYYATIWKKEADGQWTVAFNQGLILLKGLQQKPLEKQLDPEKVDPLTREVLAAERAFSDYSVMNGQLAAFYHYIDDNGITLGSGGPKTKTDFEQALKKAGQKKRTDAGKLEWEALYSHVASSGDLAYNFGTYIYTAAGGEGQTQINRGYFLTVWKKQPSGDRGWKFVLDCGNKVD